MGSGKKLNDIEKVQIKAFKDLNLSISEISRRDNRSRNIISFHFLNPNKRYVPTGFTRSHNIGIKTSTTETKDVILTYRAFQSRKLLTTGLKQSYRIFL